MDIKTDQFREKITAGITHDINNVLAGIKEYSGLMEDFLNLTPGDSIPSSEKLNNILSGINRQVQRGIKLTTMLNKFSHLPDNENAETELNELTEHLVFLTRRFAKLKNIELLFEHSGDPVRIMTNPLYLQMAIYYSIEYFLNHITQGNQISIRPGSSVDGISILIYPAENNQVDNTLPSNVFNPEQLLIVEEIMSKLGGKTELNNTDASVILKLKIK